MAGGLFVSS